MIDKNKVLKIQKEFPSHLWLKLKTYHTETYEYITENFSGDTFSEKAYQYVYGEEISLCHLEGCDNKCSFGRFSNGYQKYCSYDCSGAAKENKVKNECEICGDEFITVASRSRRFCGDECRHEYMKTDEYKQKIVKSCKKTMTKQKIEEIADEYPSHITIKIKSGDRELYDYVNENYDGQKFTEKLYLHLYGDKEKTCNMSDCDGQTKFLSFARGFGDFCSRSCSARKEQSKETISCKNCGEKIEVYRCNNKKFCSHACYVEHQTKNGAFDEQLKKARKVCREKYGGMGWSNDQIKGVGMETKKERYGDTGYNNRSKSKKTMMERYGDANFNNRKKAKKTCLEKYNDESYSNREKAAETRKRNKYRELVSNEKYDSITPLFSSDEYDGIGYFDRYDFKCNECGEEFDDYLYKGNVPRCPNCWDGWNHIGSSNMENEIYEYINSFCNVEIIRNDRSLLESKELDFYIPEKDIAIEFNGIYWHGETNGKGRNYHLDKTEACEERGVQLIHIFETEWVNKKDIVKRRLKHILGGSDQKPIYARKCSIKEIDNKTKKRFFETYHIQGAGRSRVKLGAYYGDFFNNELVAAMTFGKPSIAQGHRDVDDLWEMKRFALAKPVVGIAGKLFKHFVRNWDVKKVITYADRRWSTKLGNVYETIGFDHVGSSDPNYFYFRDGIELYHRFNFRKGVLDDKLDEFDPELTEWENMQLNGYDRIWDSGNLKYEWTKN